MVARCLTARGQSPVKEDVMRRQPGGALYGVPSGRRVYLEAVRGAFHVNRHGAGRELFVGLYE